MKRKLITFVTALLLSGVMYAQNRDGYESVHWPGFDYHQFVRPMTVIGQVYFNDEVQNRADIEVASFVGDELRGVWNLIQPYPDDPDPDWASRYYVYLPCYYNTPGETFTFKAYDIAAGLEYDICTMELSGQDDGYGNPDDPYDFHFTRTEEPTYGPEYPWEPSTNYSGEGMLVVAQIKINGQLVDRANYEVGAFCGEECRATSGEELEDWTEDALGYFAYFNIMGNDGDSINFYLYDHESSSIFPGVCNTTLEMENGGVVGADILGGDIFVLNFVTKSTFEKGIEAYEEDGGYYLIASPIGKVKPSDVTNMMENNIDLYYFDQNASDGLEWINIGDGNTNLISGKGYLYANSGDVTLIFTGYAYDGDGKVTLSKNAENNPDGSLEGWNLVGNPFAQKAYISQREFYTMNSDGNELEAVTGNSVEAMEGIFVIAETDGEILQFSTEEPDKNYSQIILNVSRNRGNVMDRAIVRFGEGGMLPKFMLNKDNTKVCIPQDNKEYAVVRSTEAGELPVNFKAAQNGTYTISVNTEEVDVNYLHLIDNLTGADINLLQTPSYSFDALTTDYASRFKLVFSTGANNEDQFSFYSNGNWIINNEGDATLQVVDVAGRIMSSEEISGCFSKHIEAASGVYMLRLINGNNTKVQKIVIK